MRTWLCSVAALVLVTACTSTAPAPAGSAASASTSAEAPTPPAAVTEGQKREEAAREMIGHLAAGRALQATTRFDADMRAAIGPSQLTQIWNSMTGQMGDFSGIQNIRTTTEQGYDVLFVRLGFARGAADAKVVFRGQQVAGLFFVPAAASNQ